jgi:hypothetical protein
MLSYDWLRQTMWVSEMPGKPRHSGAAIFAAVILPLARSSPASNHGSILRSGRSQGN